MLNQEILNKIKDVADNGKIHIRFIDTAWFSKDIKKQATTRMAVLEELVTAGYLAKDGWWYTVVADITDTPMAEQVVDTAMQSESEIAREENGDLADNHNRTEDDTDVTYANPAEVIALFGNRLAFGSSSVDCDSVDCDSIETENNANDYTELRDTNSNTAVQQDSEELKLFVKIYSYVVCVDSITRHNPINIHQVGGNTTQIRAGPG